ncbi:hypothetical protein Kpol_1042p28, partial [Vanderwaltozyma polyspora DSM 70294]
MLFYYGILTSIAMTLVIIGSFASISSIPYTALPPTKIHPLFDPTDFDLELDCHIVYKDDPEKNKKAGIMDEKHAILLPLSSGLMLTALYFIITKLKIHWINFVMKLLIWNIKTMSIVAGTFVTSYVLHSIVRNFLHFQKWDPLEIFPRYRLTVSDDNEEINRSSGVVTNFNYQDVLTDKIYYQDMIDMINKNPIEKQYYKREFRKPTNIDSKRQIINIYYDNITTISLICSAILTVTFHYLPKNWLVGNLVSVNFAIWSISHLNLKNLKSGTLILMALFLYDIYFVFGTEIMVTVATKVDLPIKLSIPTKYNGQIGKFEFAMLGLGDIALPGMFISTCYKFDIWKYHLDNNDVEFHLLNWSYIGRYFITACISYGLSIIACMVALSKFKTAQPALLYIVPGLLISTLSLAWISGDFKQFWCFQYDTIELSKNILREEDGDATTTYTAFIEATDIDDDEEDYTEEDAALDYDEDDFISSDEEENYRS